MAPSSDKNTIESKIYQAISFSVFNVIIMKQDITQEQCPMEMAVLKPNITQQQKKL